MKKAVNIISLFIVCSICLSQSWEWSSHLTGSEDIQVNYLTYDNVDDALITVSEFKGTLTLGTRIYTSVGLKDILVIKYTNTGDTLWTKQFGSTGNEVPKSIISDNSGNIYATGSFSDGADLDGTVLNSYDGEDVFLLKIQPNGTLSWIRNVGWGSNIDRGSCVIIGDGGQIYISGFFKDSIFFENDTLITGGFVDNYIVEYNSSGDYVSTVLHIAGTTNKSRINSISLTQDGSIIAEGILDNIITFSTYTLTSKGSTDLFILKVQSTGNIGWVRQIGSSLEDKGFSSGFDASDNVYLTGYISGNASVDSSGQGLFDGALLNSIGGSDIIIVKYESNGDLVWAKVIGDIGQDLGQDLIISNNVIQLTGYFSGELHFNNDTIKSSGISDQDIFIGVIDLSGNPITATSMSGIGVDWGLTVRSDMKGNSYLGGYFKSSELTIGDDILTMGGSRDGFTAKYSWPLMAAITEKLDLLCNNDLSGALTVTPYFGTYPYTYDWTPDVASDSTAADLSAGIYQVIVTDANLKKDTTEVELTEPLPIETGQIYGEFVVDQFDTVKYWVESATSSTYTWNVTGGTVLYDINVDSIIVKWTDVFSGNITVLETDTNGCEGTLVEQAISITPSTLNETENSEITIFPNPASYFVFVDIGTEKVDSWDLVIIDITGKIMCNEHAIRSNNLRLSVENLPKGLYIFKVIVKEQRLYKLVCIE